MTTVDTSSIIRSLAALLEESSRAGTAGEEVVAAFDADGTLWAGDVGDDLFEGAIRRQALKPHSLDVLSRYGQRENLMTSGTANERASQIYAAFRAGRYPTRLVCEVMTVCYAGFEKGELYYLAEEALAEGRLAGRYHREVLTVLDFLRQRSVRCLVISASPKVVVERATAPLGFTENDIIAAEAVIHDGVFGSELLHPVPFAEIKVLRGRQAFGNARWLATFGDNTFDAEMLRESEFPVAVSPKPGLVSLFPTIPGIAVLDGSVAQR